MTKELIKAIERLGDQLGFVSELTTNIYNEIRELKKNTMHDHDIWKVKSHLATAEYYYTRFHSNIQEFGGD